MRVCIKEGVYACMPWATESSEKFVIPAAHSFREDSQSVPSTCPVQLLLALGASARQAGGSACAQEVCRQGSINDYRFFLVVTTHGFYCPTLSHVPVSDNKNVRFSGYPRPRCRRMRLCVRRCMDARRLRLVSISGGSNKRAHLSIIDLTLTNE